MNLPVGNSLKFILRALITYRISEPVVTYKTEMKVHWKKEGSMSKKYLSRETCRDWRSPTIHIYISSMEQRAIISLVRVVRVQATHEFEDTAMVRAVAFLLLIVAVATISKSNIIIIKIIKYGNFTAINFILVLS